MLSLSSDRYIVDPDRGVAELSVERSPDCRRRYELSVVDGGIRRETQ